MVDVFVSLAISGRTEVGVCVGITLTVWKVVSGFSKLLASKRASKQLNLTNDCWTIAAILSSVVGLANLLSVTWQASLWTTWSVLKLVL